MENEKNIDSSNAINSHIYNFDIDGLEVYGEFTNVRNIAIALCSEEPNSDKYEWFDVFYDETIKNYEYKLTFSKDWVTCFWVYRWYRINDYVETKDYIVFYWSAFLILWKEFIFKFIKEKVRIGKIKRFDLAMDKIETVYIGQKKKSNKQNIIRVYNKIADIYVKKKQRLMSEYLLEEYMTRIEIECREEISCNIKFDKLYDKEYLLNIFYSYTKKHTDIFKDIDYKRVVLKRLDKSFDPENVSTSRLVPKRHRKTFMWYARWILKMASCPVDILIRNSLISETTLIDIWGAIKDWKLDIESYKFWWTLRNAKQIFWGNSGEEVDDWVDIPF